MFSMTRPLTLSLLFIFALVHLSQAQCVTSGYVLCLPQGSELGGIPDVDYDDSLFWDSLQDSTIVYPAALRRDLASRQNALCCDPTNDCLLTTDSNIPFCYNPDTTGYTFSDGSFGFVSNGTYYAADGSFVDFKDGYYSSADGTTGTFAPATAAATSNGAGATATSITATKGASTTVKGSESHDSATTSPVKGTQQTLVQTPTTTSSSRSGSISMMPSSATGWLGLYLACLTVFLA